MIPRMQELKVTVERRLFGVHHKKRNLEPIRSETEISIFEIMIV